MKREELATHFAELNFEPQDAVRWLSPAELKTWAYSLASMLFGFYADKREMQQGFDATLLEIPAELQRPDGEFWFDYTADTGDGFDATFTVAHLLGQESLEIEDVPYDLPRGSLLVLGGDEVYPRAEAKAYEDRFLGPFRAAFPHADPQPQMVALPGNHDWYDGLTSFLRIFTQAHSIGGWATPQTRSYFTVKLPHNWWLVGLDSQLESYFDDPQLKYFQETLTNNLKPGDGVILCCATPAWVKAAQGQPDAFNGLEWFERNFIRYRRISKTREREETGASVRLWLTGDKHHYYRYAEQLDDDTVTPHPSERQFITCGLGGAYLDVTHGIATELELLPQASRSWRDGDNATIFKQEGPTYPSVADSKSWVGRLAWPWHKEWAMRRNPGMMSFLAGVQLMMFMLLVLVFWQSVPNGGVRIHDAFLNASASDIFSFSGSILAIGLLAQLIIEAPRLRKQPPLVSSSLMALAWSQALVPFLIFNAVGLMPTADLDFVPSWVRFLFLLAIATLAGGLLSGTVLALWIVAFRSQGLGSWAMMGQAIEEGKGFLRIRITPDGNLTIHPVLSEQLIRDYELSETMVSTTGRPTKVPLPLGELPELRLIEEPFQIQREPTLRAGS